jgi:hypothetical protein
MKRLTAIVLALTLCFSLTGCMSRSERKELKATMDEANGYTTISYAMDDGTELAEPTVIYDKNDVKVTVLGITGTDIQNGKIWYRVENNTKNTITFSVETLTVNGWDNDWWDSVTVEAGKMKKDSLTMSHVNVDWSELGIDTTVGSFTMTCAVDDYDNLDDEFTTEELKTTAYGTVEDIDLSGSEVVYDNNGVKIVFLNTGNYSGYSCPLTFYLENNTDNRVEINTTDSDDVYSLKLADGRVTDATIVEYLYPHSRTISRMYLFSDELYNDNLTWDEYDEDWEEEDWDEDSVDWSQLAPFTTSLTISTMSYSLYTYNSEKTLDTVEVTFGTELAAQETAPADGDTSAEADTSAPAEGAETQST